MDPARVASEHAFRLGVLRAMSRALSDVPALLAVLAEAEDERDAVRRLQAAWDVTQVEARVVLDLQFGRVTRRQRAALDDELRLMTDALTTPWDPPLEARATVRSPRRVELVLADVEHRVEGADLQYCLDQVVALVRDELARPARRRVAVTTTGPAGAPTLILVDPVGNTHYRYAADDEASGP